MSKLQEQQNAMIEYFEGGCKPEKRLAFGLEVEHFVTRTNGVSVNFEEIQQILLAMQKQNESAIWSDGLYMGFENEQYAISIKPACQVEVRIVPHNDIGVLQEIYERFFTRLCTVLDAVGMNAYAVGYHPTRCADELPLIPKEQYQIMDDYFRGTGSRGAQMMRATAETRISIDYFSEADFIRKYRVASLIAPMLGLLTDNAPVFQAHRNHSYSVRTQVWNDVDPMRCGVFPGLMDADFGFAKYAEYLLQKPLIFSRRGTQTEAVGDKCASEVYGAVLGRADIEHIISMFFFDVRVKSYIQMCVADSMPPRFIAAYAELIKAIFSSPAAMDGILRHYEGVTAWDIIDVKREICCSGYKARAYGRRVTDELGWLMAQAKSRTYHPEERRLLNPLARLISNQKTIKEAEYCI